MRKAVLAIADRFVPAATRADPEATRRTQTAVLLCWLGGFWSTVFGAIYAALGSPISGVALGVVSLGLVLSPWVVRRGTSVDAVANANTAITWSAATVIAWRTGGIHSPALIWSIFIPLTMYAACGLRSAAVWSFLSGAQILGIFIAGRAGARFEQDLSPLAADSLQLVALLTCLSQFATVLSPLDLVRRASLTALERENRVRERDRILADMHDGVGSQMMGVIVEVKADAIDRPRLVRTLERCLDELRLAVRSPYETTTPLEVALGELRARLGAWCSAAGVELVWSIGDLDPPAQVSAAGVQHAISIVQEAVANALRHAGARRIELVLRRAADDPGRVEIAIADDGGGFDPDPAKSEARGGRGLPSMRRRGERLGGELSVASSPQGTAITVRFPA